MTLQKGLEDAVATEVAVQGSIRIDDFPSSGINPIQALLGDGWTHRPIILDFSKVTEIGSAGLGWLLQTYSQLQPAKVALFGVKPLVAQQIKLLSVHRRVPIADDRAAAIALVTAP